SSGLKIRVSVVRFRDWPPDSKPLPAFLREAAFLRFGAVFYNFSRMSSCRLLRPCYDLLILALDTFGCFCAVVGNLPGSQPVVVCHRLQVR
ncbi:MAG TPA: hypothetical protein PLN33_13410, partial [Hyphomonadaceae bacterium]|nr:hypothetical protein [Hyphomonadaceae bacterium]